MSVPHDPLSLGVPDSAAHPERPASRSEGDADSTPPISASERQLRSFVNHMPVAMGVVELPADDSDVLHLFDNAVAERFFGLQPGATVDRWARRDLGVDESTIRDWAKAFRESHRTGIPVRFALRFAGSQPSEPPQPQWLDVSVSYIGPGEAGRQRFCYTGTNDTDRRRDEEALREQEKRFHEMANAAPAMLWVTEPDGRASFLSAGWSQYTGQTEAQAVGFGWLDAVHPDDRDRAGQIFMAAAQQRVAFELDYRLRRTDGVYRWAIDAGRPRFSEAGEFLGYIGSVIDVHERKEAEDRLRESDDRLRAVFTSIDDGYCLCEIILDTLGMPVDYRFLEVNPHFEQMSGLVGALGRTALELVPNLERHWIDTYARVALAREPMRFQSGSEAMGRYFDVFATPVEPHGRFALVFKDITEQRRHQNALRESEQRFRVMADNLPLIVWMHDADGRQSFVNQTYCEYFGVDREQMRDDRWRILTHPDDGAAYADEFMASVRDRRPFHCEVRVLRADGQWRWVESWARPRFDDHGEYLGHLGTSADVTERKVTEQALRDADRRKDEFLATLAHELRNPLSPILSAVQVLNLAANGDPALVEPRAVISRQVQHMVRLIDDLLDVSRITTGRLQLRRSRVSLQEIMKQAVEGSRPHLDASHHQFTLSLPDTPLYLDADAVRLAQVFSNLLNNAAKYTEPGGRIGLTAERRGDEVEVSVTDTGIGISSEHLPKLFQMFSQVETALDRSSGGLGIGLSLVRALVEMHGGSVSAISAGVGQGSQFVVRLPLVTNEPAPQAKPPTAAHVGGRERSRRRIVIADDNQDAANSLAMMLRFMGSEVRTANDGREAIDVVESFRPNLVLLDIGMPELNGYQCARHIREQPWAQDLVLVALTGWGQEEDRQRSREAGFNVHLVKPVDIDALTELLDDLQPPGLSEASSR